MCCSRHRATAGGLQSMAIAAPQAKSGRSRMSATTPGPIVIEPSVLALLDASVVDVLSQGLKVDFARTHGVARSGPLEGPVMVLLHGGSGSWMHWIRNIAPLVAQGPSCAGG